MEFKKKMQQRRIIGISYILLGLALTIADMLKGFENNYFTSFGIALIFMGIFRLFQYRKITQDDKSMRKREVAESDERTHDHPQYPLRSGAGQPHHYDEGRADCSGAGRRAAS